MDSATILVGRQGRWDRVVHRKPKGISGSGQGTWETWVELNNIITTWWHMQKLGLEGMLSSTHTWVLEQGISHIRLGHSTQQNTRESDLRQILQQTCRVASVGLQYLPVYEWWWAKSVWTMKLTWQEPTWHLLELRLGWTMLCQATVSASTCRGQDWVQTLLSRVTAPTNTLEVMGPVAGGEWTPLLGHSSCWGVE